jgi:hypothetical protein
MKLQAIYYKSNGMPLVNVIGYNLSFLSQEEVDIFTHLLFSAPSDYKNVYSNELYSKYKNI